MSSQADGSTPRPPTPEALTEFILSLGQAFLGTGNDLPEHPQSKQAKVGLYNQFKSLFAGRHELTFLLEQMGETRNILVDGPLPETQSLDVLMTQGMAEVYIPRLAKFFERKDLISLTLKESISEQEFSCFIDVMSEPSLVTLDTAGKTLFVDKLREGGITNISFVFNEDVITSARDLPWRAQLSISRLKKDLKVIPVFQDLDAEGSRALRKQVIQDVLRPINRPDLVSAILLNADSAATAEVSEEELEDEVVACISEKRLVELGQETLRTHLATEDRRDLNGRRVLGKLYRRLRSCEVDGKEELIRDLLEERVIDFESLPEELQCQIAIERETALFLKERSAILGLLEESPSAEIHRARAHALVLMVPELVRRDLLEEVLVVITTFRGHGELAGFKGTNARQLLQEIGNGPIAALLQEKYLHGRKEDRIALGPIFQALGVHGVLHLVDIVLETEDSWVRKNACEALLGMDEEAERLLLAALCSGKLPAGAMAEVLMVFGEAECQCPDVHQLLHQYAKHNEPCIREEAAWALCRILGKKEEALFLSLLDDPDLGVRKRAIRCLRHIKSHKTLSRFLEMLRRAAQEPELEPLEIPIYQALTEFPDAEIEPGVKTEQFLVNLLKQSYPKGLRAMLRRGSHHQLSGGALVAICETLDAIGTKASLEVLEDLSKRAREPARHKLEKAIEHITARFAPEDSGDSSQPAHTAAC